MKTEPILFPRCERYAGIAGAVASVVAATLIWREPATFLPAWRCAVFLCVGPALGSLMFVLIHRLTGGDWGKALRPFLVSGTGLLPWCWLFVLPLLIVAWRTDETGGGWRYTSPAALATRTVIAGVVFLFFAVAARRAWGRTENGTSLAWVGPAGAIALLFVNHLVASDWLAALDRNWHSTAFPLVWLIGQSVVGLALAVIGAMAVGADPAQKLGYHRLLGIDLGTLLFAAAMLWCYVAFAQFLIVWSGNLPEETGWFTRRLVGVWRMTPLVLVALHFVAPLVVLLSRRLKQSRRALATVAVLLIAAQVWHTLWIMLPGFRDAPAGTGWTTLALAAAAGAVFFRAYAVGARKELAP